MPRIPRLRLLLTAVPAVTVALAVAAPAAWAEDPAVTAQARMANAEFLAYAPPPADGPRAVCLVDTGVDLNPDTESNVIERLALDGGDPGDVHHSKHGTGMAMVMGGPVNDWGSVGIWPHVRIVSVRAMPPGEYGFPFEYYRTAVDVCRKRAEGARLSVVNLSLGGAGASADEVARLQDHFAAARRDGLNVVAAAGNGGDAVEYPAAISDAYAVGAASEDGALCRFSARGQRLDLLAPGCDLDVGLPDGRPGKGDGTSDAAALTSGVLTALRSYRSDLGPVTAEQLLLSTARETEYGWLLDVEAAFRAAGLGPIVDAGAAAAPQPSPPNAGDGQPTTPPPTNDLQRRGVLAERLPQPRLRTALYRRNQLILRLRNRPANAVVAARVLYSTNRGEFRTRERTIEQRSSTLRLQVPGTWTRIYLAYRRFDLVPSRERRITRRDTRIHQVRGD